MFQLQLVKLNAAAKQLFGQTLTKINTKAAATTSSFVSTLLSDAADKT